MLRSTWLSMACSRLRTAGRRRRSGSIIIMVMVVLVLMAIIGTAFIQVTRWDRLATHLISTNNIDTVAAAALSQIEKALNDDLIDPATGNFLDTTAGIEPYDYPWTNTNATWTVTLSDNSPHSVKGGQNDDMWLASNEPDFDTDAAKPRWPHITNLNGVFLLLPKTTADGSHTTPTTANNGEVPVDFTAGTNLKTDTSSVADALTITGNGSFADMDYTGDANWQAWGADADGDGIPDSRWTWAPIRQISGVTYVMAVRIIDNSALVNANVWLGQVDSSGNFDPSAAGTDAPHWKHPSELDMGHFVYGFGPGNMTEFLSLLAYHFPSGSPPSSCFATTAERDAYWTNAGRMWGSAQGGYTLLGVQDELRMRYRNGLVNTQFPKSDLETSMPAFLRRNPGTTENTYASVTGVGAAGMQAYFDNDPRHQITARSGAAIFAPRLSSDTTARVTKVDLNKASATDISAAILKVISAGTFTLPPSVTTPQQFADQLAANIMDYKDADNHLTAVNGRYGMEALPFIAEVYCQRSYQAFVTTGATDDTVGWRAVGGEKAGYAIEFRNPFRKKIQLTDIHLWVNNSDWGALDTLLGQPELDADGVLILYHNSNTPGNPAEDDIATGLIDAGVAAGQKVVGPDTWPTTTGAISVELRATDQTGNALTWPYQKVPTIGLEDQIADVTVPTGTGPPNGERRYHQFATLGNGHGLNVLTVTPAGGARPWQANELAPGLLLASPYSTELDRLGLSDKTAAGTYPGGPADAVDPATQQLLIADYADGNILQPGELAQIAILGPTPTKTVPEQWAASSDVADFMLNFAAAGHVGGGNLDVPHAALLIDRFTTLSPAADGQDNDGDGTSDNIEEQLIPGTLNLNTASKRVLRSALPIPNATIRGQVADAIIAYRKSPAARSATLKGIAYTGELFNIAAIQNAIGSGSPGDTSTLSDGTGSIRIDFLGNPDATTADGVIDDREEKATVARWLSQVASTRSDFFTAYVVIQGYPSGDFRLGPVEATRFFVIFDRSRITAAGQSPKIVGIYKFN